MTIIATAADLGLAVRIRRRERDLTLVETAELAGVGVRFMSELENGKPTVRLDKVMQVIGALGLELAVEAGPARERDTGPRTDLDDLAAEVKSFLGLDEPES